MSPKIKHYNKEKFTIQWEPEKCIHAKECVKRLPDVYNPQERPWIKPENATVEDLISQIDACPSGALSYFIEGQNSTGTNKSIRCDVMPNGPLIITGDIQLNNPDGTSKELSGKTALCRCGASNNKPFCDGSHAKIDFKG